MLTEKKKKRYSVKSVDIRLVLGCVAHQLVRALASFTIHIAVCFMGSREVAAMCASCVREHDVFVSINAFFFLHFHWIQE